MPPTKVLLVEDSKIDAQVITQHLRSSGRFSVAHVKTLGDACNALRNGDGIEVAILDLNLPDSGGLETFTFLHKQFPNIPVVIISGDDDSDLAVAGVSQGAQDYVPKSKANADTLVRSLHYAIERNGRQLAERRNLLLERDLAIARRIQQNLLPKKPPSLQGFDVAAVCQAAEVCGGDFYDFIELPDGKCDMLIADVSSHGFGPALIMVGARRILRTCAMLHEDVGEIVTIANRALCEDTLDEQFMTLFYARLDPATRALTFCAGGHPAWVIAANGEILSLESDGIPLGLVPEDTYRVDGTVTLEPGDILCLMTDGAWEAIAPDGEQFCEQRVFDLIQKYRDWPAAEILELSLAEISRFCHPGAFVDDVTMLLLKVVGRIEPF